GVDEVRAALARPPAIDGRPVRVVDFRVRLVERSIEVEITLAEGRQRIVRRLAEALGLKVEWLHRVSYGPVRLGRLAEGKYRRLAANEVEWGNVFLPATLAHLERGAVMANPEHRRLMLQDLLDELTDDVCHRSFLYQLLIKYKPDAVVDSINTATAFAYQDGLRS